MRISTGNIRFLAIAFAIAFALPASAATDAASAKLDAALTAVAQGSTAGASLAPKLLRTRPGHPEPFVATIMRFEGSLDPIRASGGIVRAVMGKAIWQNIRTKEDFFEVELAQFGSHLSWPKGGGVTELPADGVRATCERQESLLRSMR